MNKAMPTQSTRQRGRPSVPAITRQQVVNEALAIVDAEGIAALNMRGLAERLGVRASSLYNHFENKESILVAVARLVLQDLPTRGAEGQPWQDWLARAMVEYRRILLAHPNAIQIMTQTPLSASISDSTFEHAANLLEADGVPPGLTRTIAEAAEGMVTGWVLISINARAAAEQAGEEHRLVMETNSLDEDDRFELAAYSLINGFAASLDRLGTDVSRTRLRAAVSKLVLSSATKTSRSPSRSSGKPRSKAAAPASGKSRSTKST